MSNTAPVCLWETKCFYFTRLVWHQSFFLSQQRLSEHFIHIITQFQLLWYMMAWRLELLFLMKLILGRLVCASELYTGCIFCSLKSFSLCLVHNVLCHDCPFHLSYNNHGQYYYVSKSFNLWLMLNPEYPFLLHTMVLHGWQCYVILFLFPQFMCRALCCIIGAAFYNISWNMLSNA